MEPEFRLDVYHYPESRNIQAWVGINWHYLPKTEVCGRLQMSEQAWAALKSKLANSVSYHEEWRNADGMWQESGT